MEIRLSKRAEAFRGQTIELTRDGIGIGHFEGRELVITRRTAAGERGTIIEVTDAGFAGLQFWVRLETGEHINAYESDIKVVAR